MKLSSRVTYPSCLVGEAKDSGYLIGKIHCTYTKVLVLSKIPIQKKKNNKVNKKKLSEGGKFTLWLNSLSVGTPVWVRCVLDVYL